MIYTDDFFEDIIDEYYTLDELLECVCTKYESNIAIECLIKGKIVQKTYRELNVDRKRVGTFLHEKFEKGTHIAIIGKTSYWWLCAYFGITGSENIAVPIDKELPDDDIVKLLEQGEVKAVLCDEKYGRLFENAENDCRIYYLSESFFDEKFPLRDDLFEGNSKVEDVAEIVFTSGTTGKSKGCMLTHGNLAYNAMNGFSYVKLNQTDVTMSVLPINHALELTAGILTPLCSGMRISINDSLKYMQRNMNIFKPSCMIVVPLILQTFHKRIWSEINKTGKQKKVSRIMKISKCFSLSFRRKIFSSIIDNLGGNLRLFVVGGAYLEPNIIKDFLAWGIIVIQGYGITECAPVVACNSGKYQSCTSVGKIVTGCEVKIQDGEILVRGTNVMKGYFNDEAANREAFDGDWFRTGDLGYLDSKGLLYLTGRKKNLIILPNGENISPEFLEQKIEQFEEVTEVIVKEKEGKITAEIYCEDLYDETKKSIAQKINQMNIGLPTYQHVTNIEYREEPFIKTTTRKIKRFAN